MTRVGALDCGTNSLRLLVAERTDAGLTDVARRTEIVRLGQGVDRTGLLAAEPLERTRVVLADYAAVLASHGVDADQTRLVATSALRDAANGQVFTALVEQVLGVSPTIASGAEEAGLSFAGSTRELLVGTTGAPPPPYLVVDIGGGSTELILGSHAAEYVRSVDIGAVRLTERHFTSQPPSTGELAALTADVHRAIDLAEETVPLREFRSVVCVAGTATTVAALALGLDRYDSAAIHHAAVSTDTVVTISERLLGLTVKQITALPAVHPKRADVLAAGTVILRAVLERAAAGGFLASEHDILDGIAWSVIDEQG